jgi:magnesium chelatase subunit H
MAGSRGAGGSTSTPVRFVIVTLDAHLADAFERARTALQRDMPGLHIAMHVAADWASEPGSAERARADIAQANFIACTQLFQEEYAKEVLAAVQARRLEADAVLCALCTPELVKCTRLGKFDMSGDKQPSKFSPISLLKKLRGSRDDGKSSGERQMKALRTLPSILKFVPGTAQDVRAYLLLLQYWLAGSDRNIEQMVRYADRPLRHGTARGVQGRARAAPSRSSIPRWACGIRRSRDAASPKSARRCRRAGRTARWACSWGARICWPTTRRTTRRFCGPRSARAARDSGVRVGARRAPGHQRFFKDRSGRPRSMRWSTSPASRWWAGRPTTTRRPRRWCSKRLDVPYISLQTLEFQTIEEWRADARGLNPLQATLQVAIPELDGAIVPTVYGGKGRRRKARPAASEPIPERIERVAERVARLVALRRTRAPSARSRSSCSTSRPTPATRAARRISRCSRRCSARWPR